MSGRNGQQNLLGNVFRPVYVYDSGSGYRPRLVASNLENVVGTIGTFSNLNVGDDSNNVYVGINTGNRNEQFELCNSRNITALGLNAGSNNSNCSDDSYIGNSAGSNTTNVLNSVYLGNFTGSFNSNCGNSVYIGFNAAKNLSNASNEIAIGTNAIAGGTSNVYIGTSTGSSGNSNIFIGPSIAPGNVSNQLRIGRGNDIVLYSDLASKKVGINTTNPTTGFDVSSDAFFSGKVGVQYPNPEHSLDVTGQIYATDGILIGRGNVTNPAIALVNETNTGIFSESNAIEGSSFGFTLNGERKMTVTDTCLNVFANLFVEGTFGSATQFGSNQIVTGWIRGPDSNGRNFDISQTGIRVNDSLSVGNDNIKIGNGFITDTCTNGYFRMMTDSGVIRLDLSDGNVLLRGGLIASNLGFQHTIGGVSLSNSNVSNVNNVTYSGAITGSTASASNVIGGVTLSNNTISYSGRISNTNVNSSNSIGGVVLQNSNVCNVNNLNYSGAITGSTANTSNSIGGIVLSNTRIGVGTSAPVVALEVLGDVSATTYNGPGGTAGAPHYTFSDDRTTGVFFPGANIVGLTAGGTERMRISNDKIGIGVTNPTNALDVSGIVRILGALGDITFSNGTINAPVGINIAGNPIIGSNGALSNASTTNNSIGGITLFSNAIRNATNPTTFDISGGNISNSATTRSSNFITATASSNSIGGIILSNNDISLTGRILTGTTSNSIGGVTLDSGNISNVSTITTTSTTINSIGGVTLLNGRLRMGNAGSSTVPAFTVSGDISTGIFTPTTGQFGISAGGVNIATFTPSGIGIGNSVVPVAGYLVDISGTDGNNTTTRLRSSGAATLEIKGRTGMESLNFFHGGSAARTSGFFTFDNDASNRFVVQTGSSLTERLTIMNSNGRVGINCNAPTYQFDVNGTINGTTIRTTDGTTSNSIGGVTLSNNNLSFTGSITGSTVSTSNLIGGIIISNGEIYPSSNLRFSSSATFSAPNAGNSMFIVGPYNSPVAGRIIFGDGTGWQTRFSRLTGGNLTDLFTFTDSGRFGIGTSAPEKMIDISTGETSSGLRIVGANNPVIEILDRRNSSTTVGAFQLYQNTNNCGISTPCNHPIYFQNQNNSTRMCISGNSVGIGTVTPQYVLDVNGTMSASSNEYTVYVTSDTTLSVPSGFTKAHITLVGGGGGGGGSGNGGGGGGGGGAGWRLEQLVTNPANMTIVVGVGGAGGGTGADGSNGSASTLTYSGLQSLYMNAPGGSGGSGGASAGGNGGSGYYGGGGGGGITGSPGGAGGTGTILPGGNGTAGGGINGGFGNAGGGTLNGGQASGINGGGGGGGGPGGGAGSTGGGTPEIGAPGCGGGGGGKTGPTNRTGAAGGNGYATIRFLK